jgi:hypothetical protein
MHPGGEKQQPPDAGEPGLEGGAAEGGRQTALERERGKTPEPGRRPPLWLGTLELVAVCVVLAALIALGVWFFFFAHNPLLRP